VTKRTRETWKEENQINIRSSAIVDASTMNLMQQFVLYIWRKFSLLKIGCIKTSIYQARSQQTLQNREIEFVSLTSPSDRPRRDARYRDRHYAISTISHGSYIDSSRIAWRIKHICRKFSAHGKPNNLSKTTIIMKW
jgi:hypothetical protein